jgi:DNA-binding beta-propeller fold protein YncE
VNNPAVRALASCSLLVFQLACGGDSPTEPAPKRAGIVITGIPQWLQVGRSIQLTVSYIDSSGQEIAGGGFTWLSSNPAVARVSPEGMVTTRSVGDAAFSVTGGGFYTSNGFLVIDSLITTRVTVNDNPFGVAVFGDKAYVTRPSIASIAVLSVSAEAVTDSIFMGVGTYPAKVVFDLTGTRAFVANQVGTLGVIDVSTNSPMTSIDFVGSGFAVAAGPDGNTVWVTSHYSYGDTYHPDHIYALDLATLAVVDSGLSPGYAEGLVRSPTLPLLYAGGDGMAWTPNLYELDAETLDTLRSWALGSVLGSLVVSADGTRLFVANPTGFLNVIDLATGIVESNLRFVGDGLGIALSPDGTQLAVSSNGGFVQVYDTRTMQRTKLVYTGGKPQGLAYSSDGKRLLVANEYRWVDFIR